MDLSMQWYNGYSPNERNKQLKVLNAAIRAGVLAPPTGPCSLCGDPEVPVQYHSEDYSEPYRWVPPAMYALCRHCHLHKLHKRFANGLQWQAFKAHVRRGGYARDLKSAEIAKEVKALQKALETGNTFELKALRPYLAVAGTEWWDQLTLDPASLTSPLSRPRP
jgi:hypothetical protein